MRGFLCTLLFLYYGLANPLSVLSAEKRVPSPVRADSAREHAENDVPLSRVFVTSGALASVNAKVALAEDKVKQSSKPADREPNSYLSPNDGLALTLASRGLLYEKAGQLNLAEQDFNRAVSLSQHALRFRAAYFQRCGQVEKARADWDQAVKDEGFLDDLHRTNHERRAEFFEGIEKITLARQDFDWLASNMACPYCSEIVLRAKFWERQGDQAAAKQDLSMHEVELAKYLERQNKIELAEPLFKNHDDVRGPCEHTWFDERQGRLATAEAVLDSAIKYSVYPDPIRERARFFERHGELQKALQDIETLTHKYGKDESDDKIAEIRLLARLGDIPAARQKAEALLASDKVAEYAPEISLRCRQAQLYLALGKPIEALSALATMELEMDPWAQFTYARALEEAGYRADAIRCYKGSLRDYRYDKSMMTSIDGSIRASWIVQKLAGLNTPVKLMLPPFVKDMQFVPLTELKLATGSALAKDNASAGRDPGSFGNTWESYEKGLLDRICGNWHPNSNSKGSQLMLIKIEKHGYLSGWELIDESKPESAGFMRYKGELSPADDQVLHAVLLSVPFPPLPEGRDQRRALFRIDLGKKTVERLNHENVLCSGFTPYWHDMSKRVAKHWQCRCQGSSYTAIRVVIDSNGRLVKESLYSSSGPEADAEALEALHKTTFAPLPLWYKRSVLGYEPEPLTFSIIFDQPKRRVGDWYIYSPAASQ